MKGIIFTWKRQRCGKLTKSIRHTSAVLSFVRKVLYKYSNFAKLEKNYLSLRNLKKIIYLCET